MVVPPSLISNQKWGFKHMDVLGLWLFCAPSAQKQQVRRCGKPSQPLMLLRASQRLTEHAKAIIDDDFDRIRALIATGAWRGSNRWPLRRCRRLDRCAAAAAAAVLLLLPYLLLSLLLAADAGVRAQAVTPR